MSTKDKAQVSALVSSKPTQKIRGRRQENEKGIAEIYIYIYYLQFVNLVYIYIYIEFKG